MSQQMMRGKLTIFRSVLPAGFPGVAVANPAAGDITDDFAYISTPELTEEEELIPVRGGAGQMDIGGRKGLGVMRLRMMSFLAGYVGSFGQFFSASVTVPLRDEVAGANRRNVVMTFTGRIGRRASIERDLNAGGVVMLELELKPHVYHEQVSGITPATVDFDITDHFYAGGWDLDRNQAVGAT